MYQIPGEDEYWERVRERLEAAPRCSYCDLQDPEEDSLYLDDLEDKIEADFGCPAEELCEGDLLDIIAQQTGIEATSAKYDGRFFCIDYKFQKEEVKR